MARCPDCDFAIPVGVTECERCGTVISLVCAQCNAGNPALARFCCGCGGRLESTLDGRGPSSLARPERRQVTVVFCDVVDSTALGRKLNAEGWHRLMERFHSGCGEVIERQHGRVVQLLGDGLLAYFGYPVTAEDSPRLAVAAGLEIAQWASRVTISATERLRVRVGIHTGPVIVGNIGSKHHQESLALGETPSLAARLQSVAPAGSVLISQETKRLVEGFFEFEGLGSLELKGFSEAQPVYRVLRERSPRTRLEAATASGLTPLVGRAAELSVLKDAWAKVERGEASRPLLLVGEPGIGKSRLIHELSNALDLTRASSLELRCSQHGRNSAFHPIIEGLQRLAGMRHDDAREVMRQQLAVALQGAGLSEQQGALLGSLLGLPIDPAVAPAPPLLREALMSAVAAWLTGPPGGAPRLVIVEDVHWADPSTRDLLASSMAAIPTNVLFVLSTRPEFSPPWQEAVTLLSLERLDAHETAEMVRHLAGDKRLPQPLVARLAERSECIPLYLEEMTKSVLSSEMLREATERDGPWTALKDVAIPTSLHDSLMGRLDQLGSAKPVAQLAAVLGRQFEPALLEAVWRRIPGMPDVSLAGALDMLVEAQLLLRDGSDAVGARYRFRHSLLQEESYQSLLTRDCRRLHGYVADAIVENFPGRVELEPELVAYHCAGAEDRRRAVEFWGKAGQRAIGGSAYAEAINHFKEGLKQLLELPRGPETSRVELDLRSGLGLTLIVSSGFASKDVEETYARAAELCNELGDEIPLRVLYGIWAVNLVRSDAASTQRMVPNWERLVSGGDPSSRLVAHSALATWSFWRGDYAKSIHHCELAAALVDRTQAKEQHAALLREHGYEGLFNPWVYLAWSQALTGHVESASQTWREAVELTERIADPYVTAAVFAFGAVMHCDLGDLAAAATLAKKIREICADKPFPIWNAVGFTVGGNCLLHRGERDAAISDIQKGLEMYRMTGAKVPYPYHNKFLAEAFLAAGDAARAIETLEQALAMMRVNLDRNFEPEMLRVLGEAQAALGEPRLARDTLFSALSLARSQGARLLELKAATTLAQLLREQGEAGEAKRLLASTGEAFPATRDFPPLSRVSELLGQL